MFKQEITYIDFNGTERTEDFYFHLSSPEVTRIEAELGKPIKEYTEELAANQDMKRMIDFLERIILSAYGKKTSDGKTFHKSKQIREEFEYSPAYAELFEMLLTNREFAVRFGEGIIDDGKAKKNQVNPTVINDVKVQ